MIRSPAFARSLLAATVLASAIAALPAGLSAAAAAGEMSLDMAAPPPETELGDGSIVVTGALVQNADDVLLGTSVLTGDELVAERRMSIGETLARQAGASATSFGPFASRPVLRGFQGERVRVLTDGIGSFDVSNTSVDHAVVINLLNAERIEVLRGPASLQYGSSAIGGVINVLDSRIPRKIPEKGIRADLIGSYGTAAKERSGSARIDVALGDKIVIHADGSYLKTGNLRTGGFILTPALRAIAAGSADPEIAGLADLRGRIPNTAARSWELSGGAAIITDGGNLGIAITRTDSLYGAPVRYSLDPAIEAEEVRLDMRQTRVDLRGEIFPENGWFESIRLRGGYADYTHDEIEDTGEIGSTFINDGWEGRLELVQRKANGWSGAFGAQFFSRRFAVEGEEKYLPRTDTDQFGIFTLQHFEAGPLRLEAGARIERASVRATADADLGNPDITRRFTAFTGSLGGNLALDDNFKLGLNATYSERAPAPEELFANGPHKATQAFEVGDPTFVKEKAKGIELSLKGGTESIKLRAALYHSWIGNFIFETPTGDIEDDLPVFQFRQADTRQYGAEIEASAKLGEIAGAAISVDALGDATRATISGGGAVPRIPPLRLLGGVEASSDRIGGRVEVEWASRQNRIAAFETATPGYTLVNARITFRPFGSDNGASIVLSANNIFDVVARRHASFVKDYAPLAGRDIRATVQLSF